MKEKFKILGLALSLLAASANGTLAQSAGGSSYELADASLIYQLDGVDAADQLGYSVAGGGDVNGDGRADFIVGVPFANPNGRINAGQVFVYSGLNGSLLYQIDGAAPGDRLGSAVGLRGDVNGDGRDDFIIGAPNAAPGGLGNAGSAYIYSGSDGNLIYRKDGGAIGDRLGGSVGIYGDVNADGRADFIAGAAEADPGGLADAGSAYIYSGADGSMIYRKDGGAIGDRLGGSVGISRDVNGDANGDFIIGAAEANGSAGSVYLYSGANGNLIFQKNGNAAGDRLGGSVGLTEIIDVNGDSRADFVAGAPGTNSSAGAVFIYSGSDGVLLFQKDGLTAGDRLGGSVGISGDVNADGRADFVTGAPQADFGGNPDAGLVFVYSGTNGSLLYQKNGGAIGDRLGGSVGIMGDATLDGFAEFIVGAPVTDSATGLALVFSGATGDLLYQKNGNSGGELFGFSVAGVGDVNGDGRADFIIGSGLYDASSAFLYSGADGSLLFQTSSGFPMAVAGAEDVNGDGRADFIIGAGEAFVYSGLDGSLLFQKNGSDGSGPVYSVAGAGDVNGDGRADFIIGVPGTSQSAGPDFGAAYVYSGLDGSLLFQADGVAPYDYLGNSVAGAGDVNGDGKADFITGAAGTGPYLIDENGDEVGAGAAFVYSGLDGSLLFQKNGAAGDGLGTSVAGAGDVNGDGRADFIISAGAAASAYVYSGVDGSLLFQKSVGNYSGAGDVNGDGKADFILGDPFADPGGVTNAGSAYVYSGATGALLFQINGAAAGDWLGNSVAGAGDVNGDGRADVIIGANRANPGGLTDAGSAYVYSLPCAAKGDMDADALFTAVDVVLMLNCVFRGTGLCGSCFADVNCDGVLRPSDLALELNRVFLNAPFPCL